MKALTAIIGVIAFILIISPAMAKECTPDPGYDFCWNNPFEQAYSEVQITNPKDTTGIYSNYMVGEAYIDVKYKGDKLYVYRSLPDWDSYSCDFDGCDGQEISSGRFSLGKIGTKNPQYVAFVAWDNADNMAWSASGYGWVGGDGVFNFEVVECRDDSHCPSEEACDLDRVCSPPECQENYWTCDGQTKVYHQFYVEDHKCKEKIGLSVPCSGSEVCDNGNCVSLTCGDGYWACEDNTTKKYVGIFPENHMCVEKTINLQVCGYDEGCQDGTCVKLDCDDGDECTKDYAMDNQCFHDFMDADSDGICDAQDECPNQFGSDGRGCPQGGEFFNAYPWLIYAVIVVMIVIAGTASLFLIRRRKRPEIQRFNRIV